MKTLERLQWTLILAILLAAVAHPQQGRCRVVRVLDGDTVVVLDAAQQQHRVRLANIDAPESRQPFGARSKQALSGFVFGRDVVLDVRGTDRYGRTIAVLRIEGRDVNLAMVEAGYAWMYRAYSSDPLYAAAELRARAGRRGLWAEPNPTPPWEWRRKPASR
jgi:endonuclease YncB( thermonuclease family)